MTNLFRVLTSPQQTFERIRDEKGAGWVAALVVLMVVTALAYWLSLPAVLATAEKALQNLPNANEQVQAMTRTIAAYSGFVGALISPVISMFLGGVLLLLVNLFVRGEARYMQLAKVALYSTVPGAISGLLGGLLVRLTDATSVYSMAFNAGMFFSEKKGWGFALATLIDPFALFGLFLLIIGTTVMTRRSRGSVALWILIGWVICKLISVVSIAVQK